MGHQVNNPFWTLIGAASRSLLDERRLETESLLVMNCRSLGNVDGMKYLKCESVKLVR
jgi:hypothetical protein